MSELLYKDEVLQPVGHCKEVHGELGNGQDEVFYKDAFTVELQCAQIPFAREFKYEIIYKGVILPHHYYADFVVWVKILFETKADGIGEGLSFMRQNIFTRISRIFAKSDLTSAPVSNSRELAKFA